MFSSPAFVFGFWCLYVVGHLLVLICSWKNTISWRIAMVPAHVWYWNEKKLYSNRDEKQGTINMFRVPENTIIKTRFFRPQPNITCTYQGNKYRFRIAFRTVSSVEHLNRRSSVACSEVFCLPVDFLSMFVLSIIIRWNDDVYDATYIRWKSYPSITQRN